MQRGGGRKLTLAVVGDVHSQWGADDEAALAWLGADVAIFVGDFGEENVPLIQRIAALPQPKAVLLGNHDAWFSLTPGGRRRHTRAMLASSSMAVRKEWSEGGSTPAVQAQLQALGDDHIGYAAKRWPELGLTLLGGRPFSKGGNRWSDVADFYAEHYGIGSMQDSALQVLDLALAAHRDDCKVLVAHNGPAGLGARRHSICGVDWTSPEADFGDPDLQEALDMMHSQGLYMPLVLFGHMHSQLAGGGSRDMVEVDAARGTVYINTAVVPRIRSFPAPAGGGCGSNGGSSGGTEAGRTGSTMQGHHFVLVELSGHIVTAARDVWVGVQHTAQTGAGQGGSSSNGSGGGAGSTHCVVLHEQQLLRTAFPPPNTGPALPQQGAEGNGGSSTQTAAGAAAAGSGSEPGSSGGYVCSIYRAHTGEWEPVAVQGAAQGSQAAAV